MMRTETKILLASVGLGLMIGSMDAILDYFIFYEGQFLDILFLDVPPLEVYMRTLILCSFIGFGIVVAKTMAKRKGAEAALRVSEERFRDVAGSTADWIWEVDLQARYTYVSDGVENVLGYVPEDLLGRTPFELMPEQEAERVSSIYNEITAGKNPIVDLENLNITKDGREICLLTNGVPMVNDQGKLVGYRGVDRDITERKQTEKTLRESESFTRAVLDNLPVGISVNSVDPSVTFEYMNDNFFKYYRTTRAALAEQDAFWGAVYEDPVFREEIKNRVLNDCASDDPTKMYWQNVPITRKGEETCYITARNIPVPGKPLMISTVWDVTEQKCAAEELHKEKEFTEATLNVLNDTFYVFDPATGQAVRWNKGFAKISGYTDEEIGTLKAPESYYSEKDMQKAATFLEQLPEEGSGTIELSLITKNGARIPTEYNASILKDEEGNLQYVIAIGRDIRERKQAEEALRESEERFRRLAENAKDALYRMTLPDGTYKYMSPASIDIFGYTPDEWYTNPILIQKIIHPDWIDYFKEEWENLLQGKMPPFYEYQIIHKSGEMRWLHQRNALILDNQNNPVSIEGIVTDITEQKQVEKALRESESQYKSLFDNITDSFALHEIVVDDNNVPVDYIFLDVNRAFEKQTGLRKNDIIGKKVTEILPGIENDPAQWILKYGNVALTGESISFENYAEPLQQWYSALAYRPNPGQFATVFSNVTERKRNEEALRENEKRQSNLIANISDVIAIIGEDGIIKFKSPNIEKHFGWSPEDLVGKEAWITLDDDDMERIQKEFMKLLSQKGSMVMLEYKYKCKAGNSVPIELTAVNLIDDPLINGILCNYKDISERKELEDGRNKAAKLESIGLLAGGIAHDFNNILTAIMGNISLALLIADEEGSKCGELLTEAENASMKAKDLTQQMLTFSKGGEPVKKAFCIKELLTTTAGFALRGSNVSCEFNLPEQPCVVEADEGQISQVFNNLIINADQAMPEGGIIGIRGENITVDSNDRLPLKNGKYVKLTVEDQGIGISKEQLSKIFDPYFTTKQKGSGLGLATTYSIIKRHGGYIEVESERQSGTRFLIYLPASLKQVEEAENKKGGITLCTGKILVMDDEKVVCDVITRILEKIGCEVVCVFGGTQAIEVYTQAKNAGKPFDAVILDLTIPGDIGGKDAVKKLRDIDPDLKAIVSSGYSNDPVMSNFMEYGFNSVVSKPYRITELRNVLQNVLYEKNG
jgi:PAS domain S-box-containing protein